MHWSKPEQHYYRFLALSPRDLRTSCGLVKEQSKSLHPVVLQLNRCFQIPPRLRVTNPSSHITDTQTQIQALHKHPLHLCHLLVDSALQFARSWKLQSSSFIMWMPPSVMEEAPGVQVLSDERRPSLTVQQQSPVSHQLLQSPLWFLSFREISQRKN